MPNEEPLYNSRVIQVFLEYVRKHHPKVEIDSVLKYAGITNYQVDDPGVWFNQSQVDRFNEILVQETGQNDIARKAGRFTAYSMGIGALKQYVLSFLNTISIYMIIAKAYQALSHGATAKTKKIGPNTVEIIVKPNPGVDEKPYQCKNRIGIFESLARFYTKEFAHVEHQKCFHRGDDACYYIVSWKPSTFVTLKKIRNFSMFAGILGCTSLFFVLQPLTWLSVVLMFTITIISMFLFVDYNGNKRFLRATEYQGEAAENLVEEIKVSHSQSQLVQEMGQAIINNTSVEDISEKILSVIIKHLEFTRGMILLTDQKSNRLKYTASFGYDPSEEEIIKKPDNSDENYNKIEIFQSALVDHKPYLINSMVELNSRASKDTSSFFNQINAQRFICLPIVFQSGSIGVLYVDNTKSKRQLAQGELSILTGVAAQVAISIKNIRYIEKLRKSEAAQMKLNDELELRVSERTSELLETERHLRASLKEKDMLLKEVHHRVKNNLQVVSSMLDMTRRRASNQETYKVLTEANTRIYTMALMHSHLYKSDRVDQINIGVNLTSLVTHLSQLYGQGKYIHPILSCEGIYLPVSQAQPIAFVLNELISNAYKHAFEEGKKGKIEVKITMSEDNESISIIVKDDGVGIPEEIDFQKTDSLGMKLVYNLVVMQLKGSLDISNNQGTEIRIKSPLKEETV